MKRPLPPEPNAGLELEIARRRALHHVHDAARIITDTMPYVPIERRAAYTAIVGSLSTLERQLADLEVTPGFAAFPTKNYITKRIKRDTWKAKQVMKGTTTRKTNRIGGRKPEGWRNSGLKTLR